MEKKGTGWDGIVQSVRRAKKGDVLQERDRGESANPSPQAMYALHFLGAGRVRRAKGPSSEIEKKLWEGGCIFTETERDLTRLDRAQRQNPFIRGEDPARKIRPNA